MKFRGAWQIFFLSIFLGYMFMWIMLPTNTYMTSWTPKLEQRLSSTYFREQSINLLSFSFPIMLIAALGCLYLHLQKTSNSDSKRSYYHFLKRPAVVIAPIGIVSFVELTFAAMFVSLLIWSLANYLHVGFRTMHMYMLPGQKLWHAKFHTVALMLAYVGNTCMAFLFFPVTRGSSILPLVGLTLESSIKYHIWIGHVSTVIFVAHSLGYIIYWGTMSHQIYLMLEWSSTYLSNLAGVIAFVLLMGIWVTSFARFRRKMFELFFYVHNLYAIYLVFYMLHVGVAYLCLILPGIFLFLIDRYLRFLQSRRRTRLVSARLLPNGTIELNFAKNPGLAYNPTSTLFVNVPSVCKLQWHPFTISSSSKLETDNLSVIIKTQGNWTEMLYKQLSTSLDHLQVSTEGPYEPASNHFLSRESLVMISGGSGITPLISIIREIISRSIESNKRVPKVLLVAAFKTTVDLTMLDLLLPLSATSFDISKLQIQIEAYITQEHERPLGHSKNQIETKMFKPNPSDSPISAVLGKNGWLWLGAIISSSFVMFLLLLGFVTRYHIYPVEHRGENYHYSYKILWDMFLVCASVFVATSAIFLWQKRKLSAEGKQVQNVDLPTPTTSPSPWLSSSDRELESLPHQSLVQSTKVTYGARPDLKRILGECRGSDIGVLVSGPKSLRKGVAKICASGSGKNLSFEAMSFSW